MLFHAGSTHPLAAELIAAMEAAGGDVIETTPDILSKISGKDNPQAVVGVYRDRLTRSEEHTSELQSLMRISYAVFCLKKKRLRPQPMYDATLNRYYLHNQIQQAIQHTHD